MATASTSTLTLPGSMLRRGFWLYVWRVETPQGEMLYVGRTGDSSSPNAGAPFTRMGQHLGFNQKQNALRRNLVAKGVEPEDCASFDMIAHGPLYPEATPDKDGSEEVLKQLHYPVRDLVAAMEKALADDLEAAGYQMLNKVRSLKSYDPKVWHSVRTAFAEHFPKLRETPA